MNKTIIVVLFLAVVIGGVGYFATKKEPQTTAQTEKTLEDGTIVKADGTMVKPDGTMVKTDGTMIKPDGTMIKPDGTMVKPDGTMIKPESIIVELKSQNNSGQTGKATLTDMDGKTKVVINIPAGTAGVPQPAHIHVGACPAVGAVKYPLSNVVNGKSETVLDVSFSTLTKELPLGINVHKSGAEAKIYVACGNISASAMMVKPEGAAMEKPPEGAMMVKSGSYEAYSPEKIALASAKGNVVLNFSAAWCPTCRALEANINANLASIPSNLTILKVDYDNSTDLKKKYGVTYQHTLVQVDKDGNLIKKWMGSQTLAAFVAEVK